jgi:hypothetical protein
VHVSADGPDGKGEWVEIPLDKTVDEQTFFEDGGVRRIDLNADMGEVVLAKIDELEAGTQITQIRVYMDDDQENPVLVTYHENDDEAGDPVSAKLPSGTLKFVRPFIVNGGEETTVTLDFNLQDSVVFTGSNNIIVKPVVKLTVSDGGKPVELESTPDTTLDGTAEYSETGCCGSDCVHLATGDYEEGQGTADEGRIVIYMPTNTTLGEIESISWTVKTTDGYPPHLDMFLETTDEDQSVITAEISYNNAEGIEWDEGLESHIGYNACLQTFELTSGEENGYSSINDSTMFWVTRMGSGNDNAPSSTLGEWKAGTAPTSDPDSELATTEINGDTVIERIEIEVDNWIETSEAYVGNIVMVIDGITFTLLD